MLSWKELLEKGSGLGYQWSLKVDSGLGGLDLWNKEIT